MTDTAIKKPRVTDTELTHLIVNLEACGPARTFTQENLLLALQELSNRRSADNCKMQKPVPMPGVTP